MNEKTNISIIIPIFNLDEIRKPLFNNAIKSITNQLIIPDELILVVPKNTDDSEFIKSFDFGVINNIVTIIENDGPTDFCSQFNLGVSKAKSDWVSLVEEDDELSKIWVKNVVEYIKAYPSVDLFMPIIVDTNADGQFISLTNEAVWAQSFSDELGILTNDALLAYQNFNIDGMVIKKELFKEYGGFKPSIKLTFIYEFLLRMTFKAVRAMVIPRFGYKHHNQIPGSLFHSYKTTMNPIESNWWLTTAKREYYFDNDRKISYEEQK